LSFEETRFLVIMSDGRPRSWDQFMRDIRHPIMPTSQMAVEKLAKRLCERGLTKSTFTGYKITEAGLAMAKEEALAVARDMLGSAAVDAVGMSGDEALEIVRRTYRR
jgi:hypothetical protein